MALSELKDKPQIRLGLQGYPGTGKTWAALTFPNPVVMSGDRGLGAHLGRSDVLEVPFYSRDFCKTILPNNPDNKKDCLILWLEREGRKLEPDQTLILDSSTAIESWYHAEWRRNPAVTKQGKIDDFAEWGIKNTYFGDLFDKLTELRCHVVYIAHEADKKDKDGSYSGKIRPLMTGQTADKMAGRFTDWFRQLTCDKPKETPATDKLRNWGMSSSEFSAMCNTYPRNTIYYWQTESDDIFDGKCSSLVNFPRYLPASYASFSAYMRK